MRKRTKYIFVAGGVISGLGKGIAVSSIAKILSSRGFKITALKIDPYVNIDAGTMNPTEHGEVFVTKDGLETDQDIGNYERFLETELTSTNYMTTGSVYLSVIDKERNLKFNGKCVEVVPHIPEEVISRIKKAGQKTKAEIIITEIGGTVGEYQNALFLEATRMIRLKHPEDVLVILLSYFPVPQKIGEMKTKPTQNAVRQLNAVGIQPDFILARAKRSLDKPRKEKVSVFCNVKSENVISAPDVDSIYEIPPNFEKENLSGKILKEFGLRPRQSDLKDWQELVKTIKTAPKKVKIGIVGKYFGIGDFTLSDSYISVIEAIKHACYKNKVKPDICWVDSEKFEHRMKSIERLREFNGIVVPGGFGERGVEGKIRAIHFVRENNIPFLGLCYGMQLAVVEFGRSVCGMKNAHTTEINKNTPYPVIDILPEQKKLLAKKHYGGTMRLGDYDCELVSGTKSSGAYKKKKIVERHRHRYELNNKYRTRLEKAGLKIAGTNPQKDLVEIIEIPDHPFFVASQFHPEFKSYPLNPHPLFNEFIRASIGIRDKQSEISNIL